MIKELIRRIVCMHVWKNTHEGLGGITHTCLLCGKSKSVYAWDVGTWRIRRRIKGEKFM